MRMMWFSILRYKLGWMGILFSPFIFPKIRVYIGKVRIGTPYMLPRVWKLNKETGFYNSRPRKFGIDLVPLGYKTKWSSTDFRCEWNPVWSFVFFKWQIALTFELDHRIWECYLTYRHFRTLNPENSKEYCIKLAREANPQVWTSLGKDSKKDKVTDYWNLGLKKHYGK